MQRSLFFVLLAFFIPAVGMHLNKSLNYLRARTALCKLILTHNNSELRSRHFTDIVKKINELKAAFPERVLLRYKRDFNNNNAEYVEKLKQEFIRYALLAKICNKNMGMFSKDVDNLWHTFLLFNKDYESFCSYLTTMLYHAPHEETETCPHTCLRDQKEDFITEYHKLYQELPSKEVWLALQPCNSPNCKAIKDTATKSDTTSSSSSVCESSCLHSSANHHSSNCSSVDIELDCSSCS